VWGFPPALELEREAALQKGLVEMIRAGLVDSAHDCSEGGIAVTLAESGFAKGVGVKVGLGAQGLPAEFVLFGEDASRVVISCDRSNLSAIKEVAVKYGIRADVIGETVPERLEIMLDGAVVVSTAVSELQRVYESALETALRTEAVAD
jgi:phosphoribosylformylglycinamidine synthase